MEGTVIERIKKIEEVYSLTDNQLAKRIDMPQTSLSNYIIGRTNKLPLELAEKILNSFSDISAEWLLRGEGEMLKSQNMASQTNNHSNVINGNNNSNIHQGQKRTFSARFVAALLRGCHSEEEREKMIAEIESICE